MNKTKISKIGRRGKIVLAVLVAVMFIGIASAAIIPHFGKITTTATVDKQAVELSADGSTWLSYNDPITHTIPDVVPGGTYCFKQWIRSNAAIPVNATFTRTDGWDEEVNTTIYAPSPTTTLILENKDSSWNIINDTIQATITFDTVAPTFNYQLTATGLTGSTDYTIIYYADRDPRFSLWGGDNPGAVIDTFTTDASGNNVQTNSVNLAMNLPCDPDWNINPGDEYRYAPDNYVHWQGGAKIWIVPSVDYDVGQLKVINWNPTTFLFETDLIIYLDCNIEVDDYFCKLLGEELTGPITLLSGQKIPILTCHTFDLHTSKGTYGLTTIVDATEST